PHHQVLDHARPVPLGGAALPLPPREPVVPAAAAATPAHLGTGHGEPGDGGMGGAHGLHLRPLPRVLRGGARALRLLSAGRGRGGRAVTEDKLGFLICAVTADTKAKALEAGRHFVWRMGPTLRGPVEFFSPVGMRSRAANQFALKARSVSLSKMSYEELVDNY